MVAQSFAERPAAITFRKAPMTLVGSELRVGDEAPDFALATKTMAPFSLDDAVAGGTKSALLIVVPSLDTQTCSLETQTFHKRLSELPPDVDAYIVSLDLPFAQQRWAAANEALQLTYLSDYRDRGFGPAYGVFIKEIGLLARAVFVVRPDKTLAYAATVKEVADEPNYDEVFAAVKS